MRRAITASAAVVALLLTLVTMTGCPTGDAASGGDVPIKLDVPSHTCLVNKKGPTGEMIADLKVVNNDKVTRTLNIKSDDTRDRAGLTVATITLNPGQSTIVHLPQAYGHDVNYTAVTSDGKGTTGAAKARNVCPRPDKTIGG